MFGGRFKQALPAFSLVRGALSVTSKSGSFCLRNFSAQSQAIPGQVLSKVQDSRDQRVVFKIMPEDFCHCVSKIAQKLAKQQPVTIPSPAFDKAVVEVAAAIKDSELEELTKKFEVGEVSAIVFDGRFKKVPSEIQFADFEPQHFELEGQERDEAGAAKFAHKFLPDILFSAALASSREVVGFEQIESLKPQRPHVDIDMSLEKEAASKVIYFCSEVSDPNPRIATSVISSSRILQCFSKEEIEFLQQENFFMRPSQPEDEYFVKREPFAIIQGGSFIFDSLPMDVRDLVEPIQNPNNIDFKELMSRVRMVHGILMYYDRLPTFVINEDTKVLMRNAGDGPQDLRDNVLHSRYEDNGFVGEAGGLPSNQDPFEQPVVAKGAITRVIARIAFGKGQNNEFQVLK